MDVIKTGKASVAPDESGGHYAVSAEYRYSAGGGLLTDRTVTGMKAAPTLHRLQTGTWEPACVCEGRNPSGGNARMTVPMTHAGAEQFVVVVKHRNWCGAKGLCQIDPIGGQPEGRSR